MAAAVPVEHVNDVAGRRNWAAGAAVAVALVADAERSFRAGVLRLLLLCLPVGLLDDGGRDTVAVVVDVVGADFGWLAVDGAVAFERVCGGNLGLLASTRRNSSVVPSVLLLLWFSLLSLFASPSAAAAASFEDGNWPPLVFRMWIASRRRSVSSKTM